MIPNRVPLMTTDYLQSNGAKYVSIASDCLMMTADEV